MWLQPWFFSVAFLHFGHGLVCATSHFALPPSSFSLDRHSLTSAQAAGRCASSLHRKQNGCPLPHSTSEATPVSHKTMELQDEGRGEGGWG